MTGYREGGAAVEFYKGGWILRVALPGDRPLAESAEATQAMARWCERNLLHRQGPPLKPCATP